MMVKVFKTITILAIVLLFVLLSFGEAEGIAYIFGFLLILLLGLSLLHRDDDN